MINYVCYFNSKYGAGITQSAEGIDAFCRGFWVTESMVYTKWSDAKYWIPPSQILYIEKIETDD